MLAFSSYSMLEEHSIMLRAEKGVNKNWLAVKELKFSCHNKETISFTKQPYHGNLNQVPEQQPEKHCTPELYRHH